MSARRSLWIRTGLAHSGCGSLEHPHTRPAGIQALRVWRSVRSAPHLRQKCSPDLFPHQAFTARPCSWLDPGERQATGGPRARGRATNGISNSRTARSIASGAIPKPAVGLSRADMTDRYIELHARSAFSFLEGASLPEELATRAAELNYPAMALLDRDGFYGSPRFHLAAQKTGIRAHIGAEITCTDGFQYPLLAENR